MNKPSNNNNSNSIISSQAFNYVFKNRYLFNIILRLVQQNNRQQLVRSYRYNELNDLEWILENGHQGLLKMIFDRGEFEQRLSVSTLRFKAVRLFFTQVKDRQLLLSVYNQYTHIFCKDDTIIWACQRGDVEIVKMLINQTEPSKLYYHPNDMLKGAVESGSVEMVKFIVDFISSIKTRETISITIKTANLEIINIIFTSQLVKESIKLDVDLLLGMDGPWPVYFNRDICRWRPEISDALELIANELLSATDGSTNPSECSKYLSKSSIPFKTIYKSIKRVYHYDRTRLSQTKNQMTTISRDSDPIYYPMLILRSFGNDNKNSEVLQYLVKTNHPFLCHEYKIVWGRGFQTPINLYHVTVDQAKLFYIDLSLTPTTKVDNIELFNLIYKICKPDKMMEWVSRVLEYAISELNYKLIMHIYDTIQDLDKQLPQWSFGLGKGSFISDYIEMAKLLTELNLYANEINFDCAIRSIQHPIDHLTNYQLTCLSLAPIEYSLSFAFYCNGDFMIKALVTMINDHQRTMPGILCSGSLCRHIVRYREDVIRSILNGEYGDNIWNWDDLSNLFESSCIVGKLELFEYLLVIVDKMFGEKKLSQIYCIVVECGSRTEFLKYLIDRYNTTIVDLELLKSKEIIKSIGKYSIKLHHM
ncbi:hypothetical protein DFA_02866 [Cavenderia fasciculata]|uniref:Ankyrin repeat-containing protein n=1 Tax=Cavenderia fasciculata TaxID=261658 RepID=F4PIP2_CACFS|nr:uncharacterized protein DFA_02866 [Cavenderia fasciculata]EGG24622.1 hypothetical protein DFA_02866 [Cavenderia fasciculata]|eukprot:XP_004362473.1 hypothetical protein DFA_02866 [Cavenderia fasciculata]